MKAMLWKEFRENFKWAVLAMIGLCLAEIYGLNYYDPMNYNNRGVTLCNPTFLMATSFGCAIVGLLLGFVQILPEQRRDQWAALLHRPVSRDTIFCGKVVAGVVLYLLATVTPFLLCVWLASTPGHFVAPFVPSLVLPGVADMATGLAYYFAALLLALQRGSWFGARALALFAAVHLSFFITTGRYDQPSYFYVSVEAAFLMALLLFTAAWGAMLSNGSFRARPWLGKFALLVAVFYGLCGLGNLTRMIMSAGGQPYDNVGSEYRVTMDGQPIITTTSADLTTKVTDLAGNVINDDRYKGARSYENFLNLSEVSSWIGDAHGYDPLHQYYQYRQSARHVQEVELNSFFPPPVTWFYLPEKKYFVGISKLAKRQVGIADTTGFQPAQTTPVPFSGLEGFVNAYGTPCLVSNGNTVLAFNFEKDEMFQLSDPDQGKVYGAEAIYYHSKSSSGSDQLIALAFAHAMRVYDLKGKPLATLPYHQDDLDHFGDIELGYNEDQNHYYVKYTASVWLGWARNHMPSFLEELDAAGNVVHSYVLPPLPIHWGPRSWADYIADSAQSPASWYGNLVYQKAGGLLGVKRLAKKDQSAFGTDWGHVKETSIRITLYSLAFAAIALVWGRRMRFPWKRLWAWVAFVFAFNLGGLIAFRLVADWPVRVSCPECKRKRPVEDETCPECGKPWPALRREGTEIFDKVNEPELSGKA